MNKKLRNKYMENTDKEYFFEEVYDVYIGMNIGQYNGVELAYLDEIPDDEWELLMMHFKALPQVMAGEISLHDIMSKTEYEVVRGWYLVFEEFRKNRGQVIDFVKCTKNISCYEVRFNSPGNIVAKFGEIIKNGW